MACFGWNGNVLAASIDYLRKILELEIVLHREGMDNILLITFVFTNFSWPGNSEETILVFDSTKTLKCLMGGGRDRTHSGMKTFQGGKTRIFTLLNAKRFPLPIWPFFVKTCSAAQKKCFLSPSLNESGRFLSVKGR